MIAGVWQRHEKIWKSRGLHASDLFELVSEINSSIHALFRGQQYTTLSLVFLHQGKLEIFSYGSPPFLLFDSSGALESTLLKSQTPLGLNPHAPRISPKIIQLSEGAILTAYSDGVLDGSAARRRLQKKTAGLAQAYSMDDLTQVLNEVGRPDRLPDDFTLFFLEKRKSQQSLGKISVSA